MFPMIMGIPFAYVLAVVYVPIVALVRAFVSREPLWIGISGAFAAPVAGMVLVVTGRLLFATSQNPRRGIG
jgi:hypothetical protein